MVGLGRNEKRGLETASIDNSYKKFCCRGNILDNKINMFAVFCFLSLVRNSTNYLFKFYGWSSVKTLPCLL